MTDWSLTTRVIARESDGDCLADLDDVLVSAHNGAAVVVEESPARGVAVTSVPDLILSWGGHNWRIYFKVLSVHLADGVHGNIRVLLTGPHQLHQQVKAQVGIYVGLDVWIKSEIKSMTNPIDENFYITESRDKEGSS